MGVQLGTLVPKKDMALKDMRAKTLAVDASSIIHQFLALVRYPSGVPLMDSEGNITSGLAGLFYRSTKLIYRYGMELIFIFDGKPPQLKLSWLTERERKERRDKFEKRLREWRTALQEGDLSSAYSKAVTTGMIDSDIIDDAKRLLFLLGIPVVQAPAEAEAQACHISRTSRAWAVNSRDFDCLLFKAPRMARYVSIAGVYRGVGMPSRPQLIELKPVLRKFRITHPQLIDMAILMGTDYNRGLEGIGPRKSLRLIRTYGRLENLPDEISKDLPPNLHHIRNSFQKPEIDRDYSLVSGEFDPQGIVDFLCDERDFSPRSVRSALKRISRARTEGHQATLEHFSGFD